MIKKYEYCSSRWEEGYIAYLNGETPFACPYEDEVLAESWHEGYGFAVEEHFYSGSGPQ